MASTQLTDMAVVNTGLDVADDPGAVEEQERINAAKAELYDEQQAEQNPDLILGKYNSQDDLIEAYKNLQRENERMRQGNPPDVDLESERAGALEQEPEEEESDDQPELSTEDYNRIRNNIFEQAGGEEKYQALLRWGSENLDEARTQAFNNALQAADESTILAHLKSMQYDMLMSKGTYEPKLTGGRAPTTDAKPFQSEAQVVAAMQDPRYGTDPAYIKEVEKRIAVSEVFNPR